MKRSQGQDNYDDKKARFSGGHSGPPSSRGGYPQRGGFDSRGPQRSFGGRDGGERRNDGEGYAPRRPFAGRDDRQSGGFDRQNGRSFGPRNTFRREEGSQGGYGTPQRFNGGDNRGAAPAAAAAPRPMAAPVARPVPVARLKEGVAQANRALAEVIEQFGSTLSGDYDISTLEVSVSFSEDGRFLGFGQGGAATMTLSVTPLSAEEILEGEEGELMDMDEDESFGAADMDDLEGDLEVDEEALAHAPAPKAKKARANSARTEPSAEGASTDLEN